MVAGWLWRQFSKKEKVVPSEKTRELLRIIPATLHDVKPRFIPNMASILCIGPGLFLYVINDASGHSVEVRLMGDGSSDGEPQICFEVIEGLSGMKFFSSESIADKRTDKRFSASPYVFHPEGNAE